MSVIPVELNTFVYTQHVSHTSTVKHVCIYSTCQSYQYSKTRLYILNMSVIPVQLNTFVYTQHVN